MQSSPRARGARAADACVVSKRALDRSAEGRVVCTNAERTRETTDDDDETALRGGDWDFHGPDVFHGCSVPLDRGDASIARDRFERVRVSPFKTSGLTDGFDRREGRFRIADDATMEDATTNAIDDCPRAGARLRWLRISLLSRHAAVAHYPSRRARGRPGSRCERARSVLARTRARARRPGAGSRRRGSRCRRVRRCG